MTGRAARSARTLPGSDTIQERVGEARKRASAVAALCVSATPTRAVNPSRARRATRSASKASSPPNRCATPVTSIQMPSRPSTLRVGPYRPSQRARACRASASRAAIAGRAARAGSRVRTSASVSPACTPSARAQALAALTTKPRGPFSTSAKGCSAGTAPGCTRSRRSMAHAGNQTKTTRRITPLHSRRDGLEQRRTAPAPLEIERQTRGTDGSSIEPLPGAGRASDTPAGRGGGGCGGLGRCQKQARRSGCGGSEAQSAGGREIDPIDAADDERHTSRAQALLHGPQRFRRARRLDDDQGFGRQAQPLETRPIRTAQIVAARRRVAPQERRYHAPRNPGAETPDGEAAGKQESCRPIEVGARLDLVQGRHVERTIRQQCIEVGRAERPALCVQSAGEERRREGRRRLRSRKNRQGGGCRGRMGRHPLVGGDGGIPHT